MSSTRSHILLTLLLLVIVSVSTTKGSEVDACGLEGEEKVFCQCNSAVEAGEAEEAKCNAWGTPPNLPLFWSLMMQFKNLSFWEFTLRDERIFTAFPPPYVFTSMRKLTYFSLQRSVVSLLPSHAFGNSSSLSEVVLKDNHIALLEPHSIANMVNISKINLGTNHLQEIGRNVFVNLPKLQFLFLDRNHIQVVHDGAFKDLDNLEELDLQRNNLTVIAREVFSGLKKLTRLELQENGVEYLGDHVFAEMPLLQELDLHSNEIRSVNPYAFHGLKRLARVNLKENKIVALDAATFTQMGHLYMLDLRDNALETFGGDLVEPIYTNLKNMSMQLLLTGNRLKCDCRILWMPKLYEETESEHVKRTLEKITCDMFHPNQGPHRRVSYTANVTASSLSPQETTTYAFDGTKSVIQLNPEDFKCHHHHHASVPQQDGNARVADDPYTKGHPTPVASENKKDLQQSQHQSHVDTAGGISGPSSKSPPYPYTPHSLLMTLAPTLLLLRARHYIN